MDGHSIEIRVTLGVVRKVVDSPISLGHDIRLLARHQPGDE